MIAFACGCRCAARVRRLLPLTLLLGAALVPTSGACGDLPRLPGSAPALSGGRITATFHGLRSRKGYLRVSVYDRAETFPGGASVARRDIWLQALDPALSLDSLSVTFDGLPPGSYAVCAFHDNNGRGKLTQNFLGMPQEEWGMSGNPRVRFRAPRFDQARLALGVQEAKTLLIMLHR